MINVGHAVALHPRVLEFGEITAKGRRLVHGEEERTGNGEGAFGLAQLGNQCAIVIRRLVDQCRAGHAPNVQFVHDANLLGQGMAAEAFGTPPADFFGIGENKDKVIAHAGLVHEGARRFQHGDAPRNVVRRARPVGHRVIMGAERDGTRVVRARNAPDDRLVQLDGVSVDVRL